MGDGTRHRYSRRRVTPPRARSPEGGRARQRTAFCPTQLGACSASILVVVDTSHWSAWPGPLAAWRASYRPVGDDIFDLPVAFLADNRYFQLATRPVFELWNNEPLTVQLQAQASVEQIRLFAVYVAHADIENGGFWQWLGNSYSCLYPSLLEGHRMLGRAWIADVVENAVRQVFPDNHLPLDHEARSTVLDELMASPDVDEVVDQLGQRDRTYYSAIGLGDNTSNAGLLPMMCQWIDQHAERFFSGGPTSLPDGGLRPTPPS